MKWIKRIFIFNFFLLNISAYSQNIGYIDFQALLPPKVVLPPDAKTIVFVDRNIRFETDKKNQFFVFLNKVKKDTVRYDSTMTAEAYKGFRENISEIYQFDSIPLVTLPETYINDTSNLRKIKPLEWNIVDSICNATYSDIMVSLEDMMILTIYKINSTVYEDYFYSSIDILAWMQWRIYDPFLKKYVDIYTKMDSLYIEGKVNHSYHILKRNLKPRKEIIKETANLIGSMYAERISPIWEDVSRIYFKTGNKEMLKARSLVADNKWDECKILWERIYNTTDKIKIKGRTAYNLAVINEITDNILASEEWIKKSVTHYEEEGKLKRELNLAKSYQQMLKIRKEEMRRIKEIFEN